MRSALAATLMSSILVVIASAAEPGEAGHLVDPSGDRERGGAGRSGSPRINTVGGSGDRERGGAGRSGSPPINTVGGSGDRERGGAGRSGSPPINTVGGAGAFRLPRRLASLSSSRSYRLFAESRPYPKNATASS